MSTTTLRVISSMATKALLTDLVALFKTHAPQYEVQVESLGGVDAAKRVQAGEAFDCVVLASNAIDKLLQGGQLLPGSRKDLVHSSVAVAIPQGAALVDISTEEALKQAVLHAPTLGISTGPSGVQLAAQFDRWGISEQIQDRMVQAKPGVPVAALIAQGEVALGFQQLSEMMGVPGITVLGPLPEAVQINTTFSGSVAATSDQADAVRTMLAFWASTACAGTKVRHGMQAA